MRLPSQNLLFGISRRGTANSPKCFSTPLPFCPLPFALHHLLINWVRFPCLSCLSTNSERKGEREKCAAVWAPPGRTTTLVFILFPQHNVMCNVNCALCKVQWQQQLLFSFPQPGAAPSWLWPNPCFYQLLIDPPPTRDQLMWRSQQQQHQEISSL